MKLVGILYEATRTGLAAKIKRKEISVVEMIASNHQCYFCRQKIDGNMLVLEDSTEEKYFLDALCYRLSLIYCIKGRFIISTN